MQIKVEIKTKCEGKFCSRHCLFFKSGVISDWCSYFGELKRVKVKENDKIRFISYRHPICIEETIIGD